MEVSVKVENLEAILKEIKCQYISIAVRNKTGKWSDQYFDIDDIKDIKSSGGTMTAIILHSHKNSECVVMDIRSIKGIRLNKYLFLNGGLAQEVTINRPA
jgi:hypothetical protein